jgi:hypothetical protein
VKVIQPTRRSPGEIVGLPISGCISSNDVSVYCWTKIERSGVIDRPLPDSRSPLLERKLLLVLDENGSREVTEGWKHLENNCVKSLQRFP